MTNIDYGAMMLDAAATDVAAERHAQMTTTAKIAVAQFWPTLADAESEKDLGFRIAYLKDRLVRAMADAGVSDPVVQDEVVASLREDYRLMTAATKCEDTGEAPAEEQADEKTAGRSTFRSVTASDEVLVDSTTANVGDDVWVFLRGPSGSSSRDGVVTSVDKAVKTVTVKTKSWDGNKTVTISDYSHEDGGSFLTRQGSRKTAEVVTRPIADLKPGDRAKMSNDGDGRFETVESVTPVDGGYVVKTDKRTHPAQSAEATYTVDLGRDPMFASRKAEASRKTATSWGFIQGWQDYHSGRTDNPFQYGTPSWEEYRDGKASAQRGEPEPTMPPEEWTYGDEDPSLLMASRKTAASGWNLVDVGDEVIWTDFGVPDFHDEVFRTDRGQNGKPWTVTQIERLDDYASTRYPLHQQSTEREHLYSLADEWIEKHPYTGLSEDPKEMQVAHIERGGSLAVVPLNALVRSSVEVGQGQGEFTFASRKTAASGAAASREKTATGVAPSLPLLRGFGYDGAHYSRHGYLTSGSPEEYWVNDGDGYRQIDQATYEAALAEARSDPRNDVYRMPGTTAAKGARKTALAVCPRCTGIATASASKIECMDCGHAASRRTASLAPSKSASLTGRLD